MGSPDKPNPGVGQKPDDADALPLCHTCHVSGPDSQHAFGNEGMWWKKQGIDNPIRLARSLYRLRESLDGMRALVFAHIDESPWT